MKKVDVKLLFLIFMLSLLLSTLIFVMSSPKYQYISIYDLKNKWYETSCKIGYMFPYFNVYDVGNAYDIRDIINKNEKSIIIFDGCDCKDESLKAWIYEAEETNVPVIYIYFRESDYKKDTLTKKYKNVNVYVSSLNSITKYFTQKDISEYPIAYIVNKDGLIMEKKI